ncbi:MAG TPA: serine/threonine-protein kinase, partial [Kofleriaceae bacterium]|nr:serine/threonine-protein kinase [Kofleriaceae bacterium]
MYLGNYHLIGLLATGGMAELHLACARTTAGIERIVVVKQLLPEYVSKRGYVEMFLDEGRAIAALVHSNIVQLHDMAIHDGVPYLVMEYLRGHNLAKLERRLRAGGELLPMGHALAIGSAMCAGLHHAHEAKDLAGTPLQIVHRDVSPHNVMLTYDGAVKVIDFGIAKAAGRIHETRAGTLKGKLRYMAPEQVRSADIDRRADIYAVGVTLYELLTLQLPYRQRSEQMSEFSIMTAITAGNLRPARELRPEIPESLERELMRAMSLDPKERHATARELQSVLDGLARTLGLETQPADLADLLDRVMGPPNETWRALLRSDPGGEVEVIAEATRPGTSAATVATRALAPDPTSVMLFTAPASLDDSFAGAQVAESFHAAVVVDGAQVERIDIAGVRQWLTLLECLNQRSPAPRLFLARCSEPLFAQLAAVHAFAGQAQLVSFAAGYQCGQCGHTFSRVVDLERDLALLDVGHLPMVPCPRCAAVCEADDELLAIDVVRPWLGVPVPAIVREQVALLERGLATAAQPADVDSAAKARASASKLVRSSSPRLVP